MAQDRGLRAAGRPADRGARRPRRLDRLALLPPLRLGRLLRRAARRARERPLAPRADRRRRRASAATSTTRSSSRRRGRPSDGSVARVLDFMPPRGKAPDIVRIVEGVKGRVHFRSELTIRFDYGRIVPWVRKRTHEEDTRVALAGPGRALLPHAGDDARRGHADGLGVRGRRGRARPVRPHVVPVARGRARARSTPSRRSPTPRASGGSGARQCPTRAAARVGRARAPLAHRAQGAHLRPDRRDRRGADDVAARVDRLRPQLGLPLLLAARRDAHAARAAPLQPRGRGGRLAALADPRGRGRPGRRPDHVRRRRRAAPDRVRAAVARRLRGLEAGAGRQRGERAAPARRLRRGARLLSTRRACTGCGSTRRRGGSSSRCSTTSRRPGASPTTASGRSAASAATSSTRRRWRGSRSTARCGRSRSRASTGPVDRWRTHPRRDPPGGLRPRLRRELGSFTQSYGSKELDASLLLLPLVGFLPATDPRIRGTIEAVERELLQDGFVLRYRTQRVGVDGLPAGEGVFLPCSFWLADCYELLGRHDEALRALRAARRPRERPRPAVGGVRPQGRSGCSETSRRRSPISRS